MPGRELYSVVRDQPDTVRCPADFTRIFRCNCEFIYIKICIFPKKQVVKKKRLRLTLTLMVMETTLAQDCKNSNSTCLLHFNHPQLKRNIYFCIYDFGLEKWYIYVNAICTSAKTRRFSPVAIRLIKHRPVPDLSRFFNVLSACQTSYDVQPGTVRCPVRHRWNRTIFLCKNCPVPV